MKDQQQWHFWWIGLPINTENLNGEEADVGEDIKVHEDVFCGPGSRRCWWKMKMISAGSWFQGYYGVVCVRDVDVGANIAQMQIQWQTWVAVRFFKEDRVEQGTWRKYWISGDFAVMRQDTNKQEREAGKTNTKLEQDKNQIQAAQADIQSSQLAPAPSPCFHSHFVGVSFYGICLDRRILLFSMDLNLFFSLLTNKFHWLIASPTPVA